MLEIIRTDNDSYQFHLKSASGGTILKSTPFKDEAKVKDAISTIKNSKESQFAFERKTNHEGKFLFEMRNCDGKLIGKSLHYDSEAGMENGIKNLKKAFLG